MRLTRWKPVAILICSLLSLSVAPSLLGQGWSNGYTYRRAITIDHTKIPNTDQTNFPLLISGTYPYLATTANSGAVQNANGYDIIFTSDAAGTSTLPFEQESYSSATGQVNYWVQVPNVSHTTDTVIFMFYGNASITTDQSNKTSVWDSNYHFVHHLWETSGLTTHDSTRNGLNGTKTSATNPSATSSGWIDGAQSFTSSNSGSVGIPDSTAPTAYTIAVWVQAAGTVASENIFTETNSSGPTSAWSGQVRIDSGGHFQAYTFDGGHCANFGNGCAATATTVAVAGTWYYVVATATNGGNEKLYVNGNLQATSPALGTMWNGGTQWKVGSNSGNSMGYFNGVIDELEVSNSVRSADWIAAQYNNQSSPSTFYGITSADSGGTSSPTITGLTPTSGAVGASVTLRGTDFGSLQGSSTVAFNGTTGTPTSWIWTSIVAPVPTGATTGNVFVTVAGANSNGVSFTVVPAPSITSLSATTGAVGAAITITGANFGSGQGSGAVTFNGTVASVTSWSNASIAVTVPSGASTGNVVVFASGVNSNGVNFTVTPTITNLSPTSGTGGIWVALTGTAFGSTRGSSTITFNGTAGVPSAWNATSIVVPVPSNATTGAVVVTVGGFASNGMTFTVASAGTISGTIVRSNDGAAVSGAVVRALQSGVQKGSATSGAGGAYSISGLPAGIYDLSAFANGYLPTVQSSNLVTATSTTAVNLTLGLPTITSVSPSAGAVGQTVTISGSYFGASQANSVITFNGTSAAPTTWSNTSILLPIPTGATTGPVVVSVAGLASNSVNFTIGTGAVTGTITNANGGGAIGGGLVEVLQSNTVVASTNTAANGTYTISGLAPGVYDIRVSASGFGTSVQGGQSVTAGNSTTVNASLSSPGTISGKVTRSDGITPISGASVEAQTGARAAVTTTDGTGAYSIPNLTARTYNMQVSASGYIQQVKSGVSVTAGNTTTLNFSLSSQPSITYSYDASGRLTGVVNSLSNAAGYNYDAVGNLVAISLKPSSQTAIYGFTPQTGPVGTSVTINGAAFSTTIGQNSVSFNGTPASITSATTTQLVATVPSGAASGPITVIAPGGSATSAASFTVGTSNGAPIISGFSPLIGLPGTAVTINGSNFDTTTTNDRTAFNGTVAPLTSALITAISATVPNGSTSGHLSVTTAQGRAVSSGDFFVPPSGSSVSSIGSTGRITLGGSANLSFSAGGGHTALLLFDGVAGQRVSLNVTNATFGQNCNLTVSILTPNSTTLISNGCMYNGFFDPTTLPVTGTYTIVVSPAGTAAGSLTISVYAVTNSSGTIAENGPGVNLNFSTPGQNASLTFNGISGQSISLNVTNATFGQNCNLTLSILNPDGTTRFSNGCMYNGFVDATALTETGTYTIIVDPAGAGIGSLTVTLYTVTNISGTITENGPGVNLNFTTPGQNASLTFSGTSGQSISLNMTNATFGFNCNMTLSILNPDGTTLFSNGCMANGFVDATTLTQSGTYTIVVNPSGAGTGSLTVTLYTVTNISGTITENGPGVNLNFTTPGQNASLTFSGTSGQSISVHVTNATFGFNCNLTVSILNPNGTTLISNSCMANASITGQTLSVTGTYTLVVNPAGAGTGSLTIALTSP